MYILIADSGSTKTDWVLLQNSKVIKHIKTIGFNPYFQSKDQISLEITNNLKPYLAEYLNHIKILHYYGAGCPILFCIKHVQRLINRAIHLFLECLRY